MENFVAYGLTFDCAAETPINLPCYSGTSLRGAFFGALRHDFCMNKGLDSCLRCPTAEVCPICRLIATVEREGARGAEIPRPFALQPVLSSIPHSLFCLASDLRPLPLTLNPCDRFSFGITLFGQESLALFPYAILAVQRMGEMGVGFLRQNDGGRFALREAKVANPLSGIEKPIYSHETRIVHVPDVPITHQDVLDHVARMNAERIEIDLVTPVRLVVESTLVQKLTFRFFMQRLLRRLTDLYEHYNTNELSQLPGAMRGQIWTGTGYSTPRSGWAGQTSAETHSEKNLAQH